MSDLNPVINNNTNRSCFIIGNGGLAVRCTEILKEQSFTIKAIVSDDNALEKLASRFDVPFTGDLKTLCEYQSADYIFSINNSFILNSQVRAMANVMAINFHDSPLPKYAGLFAPNWAILNGEKEHGISWHIVIAEIDAGDIVAQKTFPVLDDDSVFVLNTKCYEAALESFKELLKNINENNVIPVPQNLQLRTYYGQTARPQNFGILNPYTNVNFIDLLLKATKYGAFYDNEFALPLLSVNKEIYTLESSSVIKKEFPDEPGTVIDFEGKRGIICEGGVILPKNIFDKYGHLQNIETLLPIGTRLSEPDKTIAGKASEFFRDIARFEYYWKREFEIANFINWPGISGIFDESAAKTAITDELLRRINNQFPEDHTNDVLSGMLVLYLLCLSGQHSGTFGYIPADLPEKICGIENLFSNWLPLNITIDYTCSALSQLEKVIEKIKEIKKRGTFTRTLPIRYHELRVKTLSGTDTVTIISESTTQHKDLPGNNIIPISMNEVSIWFEMFINNLTEFLDEPLDNIDLISSQKLSEITQLINKPVCDQLPFDDVFEQFSQIVANFPGETAIVDVGKSYSYSTFFKDVEDLSLRITDKGIVPGNTVAVMIGRKYNYFVAIMAVMRCKACFLPIDPSLSARFKNFFITDSGASLVITHSENSFQLKKTHLYESSLQSEHNESDNIAYIIYTSGTSGNPKGVRISRNALTNFVSGAINLYEITRKDRILQFSNLSFDASIEEIFCAFCSGASLFLRTDEMLIPKNLMEFTKENNISVWDLPTAFWRQLIQSEYYINNISPQYLRLVIIGGEAVKNSDITFWKSHHPYHRLINTYGPTEATVVALAHEIGLQHDYSETIPIGQPLPGTKIYIVNSNRKVVPLGITGELLLCGKSLFHGYLNREEETKKTLVSLLQNSFDAPEVCYCTGDLVSASHNGLIVYQGRTDSQIKRRGYRIEPLEIERQISLMNGIETCVVVVTECTRNEKSLIAFIKRSNPDIELSKTKEEIANNLLNYMMPDLIIEIEDIPLTKNGKADKKVLLSKALERIEENKTAKAKPTNQEEEYMLDLWAKVLYNDSIGIDDDFFELGGHSLKAIQIVSAISQEKGVSVPISSLIKYSTVRQLSTLLCSGRAKQDIQCLVPVRTEGKKPPIFLIHGAGLNILFYQSMINDLKPDRPIYALQAKGIDGKTDMSQSIEEMAMDYIKEIQKVQPLGPYNLLGFSLGGFIAFDMAKKLNHDGFQIGFVGLIDSVAAFARHIQSPLRLSLFRMKYFVQKSFYALYLVVRNILSGDFTLVVSKYQNIIFLIKYHLSKLGFLKTKPPKVSIKDGVPQYESINVEIVMHHALNNYSLTPADIEVNLFKAIKKTFYVPNNKDNGWSRFALKGVIVHPMPTEHSKIFSHENSKYFASVLDKKLDEIENNG